MQDSSARRKPTLPPRDCAECSMSFIPGGSRAERCPDCSHARTLAQKNASKRAARAEARDADPPAECSVVGCEMTLRRNNSTGRCQEHRHIPGEGMGTCAHGGCDARLRRDNQSGYCEAHKYATARMPERQCVTEECGRKLRGDNESGFCPDHVWMSEASKASRDRYYERQREERAQMPDTRPVCAEEGCENRLRSDNDSGRCREHHYEPLEMPECAVGGCENRLTAANGGDRCTEHKGKYWDADAPKCKITGCGKTLQANNTIGYCLKHRDGSPERLAAARQYYYDTQAERLEYARIYREVYAEEHREGSRRWARENPGLRAAARMRRRERGQAALTEADLLLSQARCLEAAREPCFYCGAPFEEIEHYFPLCKGGTDAWQNLLSSCSPCNRGVDGKHQMCGTAFMLRRGTWKPHNPIESSALAPAA